MFNCRRLLGEASRSIQKYGLTALAVIGTGMRVWGDDSDDGASSYACDL